MIVKFLNTWHVPGFGRRRFPAGIVEDVPDKLKDILPKTAEVIDEKDHVSEEKTKAKKEELLAADMERASLDVSKELAGISGYAEEGDNPKIDEDDLAEKAVEAVTEAPKRGRPKLKRK